MSCTNLSIYYLLIFHSPYLYPGNLLPPSLAPGPPPFSVVVVPAIPPLFSVVVVPAIPPMFLLLFLILILLALMVYASALPFLSSSADSYLSYIPPCLELPLTPNCPPNFPPPSPLSVLIIPRSCQLVERLAACTAVAASCEHTLPCFLWSRI